MRILFLDIETAPNLGYVWGLWQQNVAPKQVASSQYVLCWAAKWFGEQDIMFDSVHQSTEKEMLVRIHKLLDEADVVVHYYGTKFDIPMLNSEFIKHGMTPPSPYRQVDLKQVVASQFRFPSNKLEYVAKALGLGEKLDTDFKLWLGCMRGDEASWRKMEAYNKRDTRLLERLYIRVLPWIKNHPNHGSYSDTNREVCPNCGGTHNQRRGYRIVRLLKYPQFQCVSTLKTGKLCGTWFRSNIAVPAKKVARYVGS